jgi:hypothetical protein
MSRLASLTVDNIRDLNNSELLTTLEVLKNRIGSGRKNSKSTKQLEKTFCYLDDERQRRVSWGFIIPKEKREKK